MSGSRSGHPGRCCALALAMLLAAPAWAGTPEPRRPRPPELTGTWRGTSTCTDRVAAPNCHDEVVVYDFRPGQTPGTVVWKADKVVDGQRLAMGEMELAFDSGMDCWKAEFAGRNASTVWCLKVNGTHISGTGKLQPGNERVRQIEVDRDSASR